MESTGSYWKPVFNILEGSLKMILANPEHVKALRGKKTDPNDSRWLASLLRHGLVQGSFIPPRDMVKALRGKKTDFPKILARLLQLWDRATGMQSTVPPELAN